jgi:hypothetical protein
LKGIADPPTRAAPLEKKLNIAQTAEQAAKPVIKPTIGRKVWYWSDGMANVLDQAQAFDATIVFVHNDTRVSLRVTDHLGHESAQYSVQLRDHIPLASHGAACFATWPPRQESPALMALPVVGAQWPGLPPNCCGNEACGS